MIGRIALVCIFILAAGIALSQNCGKAPFLVKALQEKHIAPKLLDDSLSSDWFDEIFFQFDPNGVLFHANDIVRFETYRYSLDDEIKVSQCRFQQEFRAFYLKKIQQTRRRFDSLRNRLDFRQTEYSKLVNEGEVSFTENSQLLVQHIIRTMKGNVLGKTLQNYRVKDSSDISVAKFNATLPASIERTVDESLQAWDELSRDMSSGEKFEATYLRALAQVFDPHSDFFTQNVKREFDEAISDERLSFGIQLHQKVGSRVCILQVVPGGSAWRSGQLHKGDIPVLISWDGQPSVDLADKTVDEIDEIFHDARGKQAKIVFLKPSGEKITLDLVKEKIENTENSISGFLLSGEQKIGYIHLPGFFTDEDQNNVNGCANEVAKEILKLNKHGMAGLILDLRNNGGGSLQEAVDLAGIFIDAGPMVILEEKGQPTISVKDANRGAAFAGPLIVLVNSNSASASELVAAALQDYNRAVIVGSTTFGKATGQVVLPLQSANDFYKVTDSRLYRINQKSLQRTGVIPDIELPEVGAPLRFTEKNYRNSLAPKTIDKKTYYTVGPIFYWDALVTKSRSRIESSENFSFVKDINDLLVKGIPLKVDDFVNYSNNLERTIKNITMPRGIVPFSIKPSEASTDALDIQPKSSQEFMKEVRNSPYIQEAFYILCDMLKSKKP